MIRKDPAWHISGSELELLQDWYDGYQKGIFRIAAQNIFRRGLLKIGQWLYYVVDRIGLWR
ncbi:MAG: hypothetical protein Q4C59_11410 [Lachnospiraceae bacterium]|nr:hypothetical protein [Lachnospiraceae bacterium]